MTNPLWHRHPHVRTGSDLTFGERAADRMRAAMGSWRFVFWSLTFISAWIFAVDGLHWPIDNPQLTILNLELSCFAALQGAIILLAANRQDAVTAELATAHYAETKSIDDNGVTLLALNRQQLAILHELRELRALVEAQDDDMKGGTDD